MSFFAPENQKIFIIGPKYRGDIYIIFVARNIFV
jgi:hypothetical protein